MMTRLSEITTEQVLLEKIRVGVGVRTPNYVLRNMDRVETWWDHATDSVIHAFSSHVLAQKLDEKTVDQRVEWDVPASWWQMFKVTYALSWWFAWFVRRWPAKTVTKHKFVTIRVSTYAAYPDASIALPNDKFGAPVIFNKVIHSDY